MNRRSRHHHHQRRPAAKAVKTPAKTQPKKEVDGRDITRYSPIVNSRSRKLYAVFSKGAYAQLHSERQEILNDFNIEGWRFIPQFSDNNMATYHSHTHKKFVVAFRGTDFTSIKDLLNDVVIVFGKSKYLPRVKEGVRMCRQIIRYIKSKYPDHTLEVTGHSLGGKVGLNVSIALNLTSYLYNIGSSPTDKASDIALKGLCAIHSSSGQCQAFRNIVHFHVVGDPISASAANAVPWKVERQAPDTSRNPHTIDNFI